MVGGYQALTNIEEEQRKARFRPIVYVCSPFAGDIERNIANARRYCRFAVDSGSIPLAPHLLFPQFMDDSNEHDHGLAMFMNMALMSKRAEVWVFGEHMCPTTRESGSRSENRLSRAFTLGGSWRTLHVIISGAIFNP